MITFGMDRNIQSWDDKRKHCFLSQLTLVLRNIHMLMPPWWHLKVSSFQKTKQRYIEMLSYTNRLISQHDKWVSCMTSLHNIYSLLVPSLNLCVLYNVPYNWLFCRIKYIKDIVSTRLLKQNIYSSILLSFFIKLVLSFLYHYNNLQNKNISFIYYAILSHLHSFVH